MVSKSDIHGKDDLLWRACREANFGGMGVVARRFTLAVWASWRANPLIWYSVVSCPKVINLRTDAGNL